MFDYESLFETMPTARLIVRPDCQQDYIVERMNKKAAGYFGVDVSSGKNLTLLDLFDPDNANQLLQALEVALRKKTRVTIQTLPTAPELEEHIPGFWITPILDDEENVTYLDIVGRSSMTGQKVLQDERDDALILLTSIFDMSEISIVVTDAHHKIVRVNESFSRLFGWELDELLDCDFSAFVPPGNAKQLKELRQELEEESHAASSIQRGSGEMTILHQDGQVADVLYTNSNLKLSQGRIFQVITMIDITTHKAMEWSLRRAKNQADAANRSKSAFLANMSHELRTPLNAIIGFSEMMMKEVFGPLGKEPQGQEKYAEYMEDVHGSAKHLLGIINEVLDMSKIESGRVELQEELINVPVLIDDVSRMMAAKAFGSQLHITHHIEEDLPLLLADLRMVRQMLMNLMSNAIKYSHSGGAVEVRAALYDNPLDEGGGCQSLYISVIDSGIGIAKNRIREALEPFVQVSDPVLTKRFEGTGLGLPLVKAMMDMHQGSLKLHSGVNAGTKAIIRFPVQRLRNVEDHYNSAILGNSAIELAG